jgi:primase-polymerase (primpol)-like protein
VAAERAGGVTTVLSSLKAKRRWVCWKLVGDKKIPYRPRLPVEEAKVNDEDSWGTHDEAVALVEAGEFTGKGYVLGDGEAGVDLDDCRHADGDEVIMEYKSIPLAAARVLPVVGAEFPLGLVLTSI